MYVMRCYFLVYSASVIRPPTLSSTHNLYSSQRTSNIRNVNSCRTIGVEHAAGTGGIHKYVGTTEREKPHYHVGNDTRITLNFYLFIYLFFTWILPPGVYHCHRVLTQLQFTNTSISKIRPTHAVPGRKRRCNVSRVIHSDTITS